MHTEEALHPTPEVDEPVAPAPEPVTPEPEPVQQATVIKMFKYSEFIDVGDGAAECEHSRDGACEEFGHFHAWCRLPNPIQQESIRKKGAAAKARLVRLYQNRDSDESVVLDSELSTLADPVFINTLIDELVHSEFTTDYLEAERNVQEQERFEHYTEDRAEYARLNEGDRPVEEQSPEYKALTEHITAYMDALREEINTIQEPKRADLRARDVDAVVELVRNKRIAEEGDRQFLDTFNTWMWLVGTFHVDMHPTVHRPFEQMWSELGRADVPEPGTMFSESSEVINALRKVYGDLQVSLQRASSGN